MPISLDVNELRTVLSDEIRKIQKGETTAANVNAIVNATGKILSSVKLQMEYARLTGKPLPEMSFLTNGNGAVGPVTTGLRSPNPTALNPMSSERAK